MDLKLLGNISNFAHYLYRAILQSGPEIFRNLFWAEIEHLNGGSPDVLIMLPYTQVIFVSPESWGFSMVDLTLTIPDGSIGLKGLRARVDLQQVFRSCYMAIAPNKT